MQGVGFPRTDVEVRVVDDDDRAAARRARPARCVVRGGVVMAGYWDQPDATAEALRGGWLHTGDVGSLDDDGFLTLRDRSKDLIISGGMNIYPREVEEALLTHPHVEAVAVVGRPDPEWGESVVAFVVTDGAEPPRRGARPDLHSTGSPGSSGPRTTTSSTRCRRTTTARSSSASCASGCADSRPSVEETMSDPPCGCAAGRL